MRRGRAEISLESVDGHVARLGDDERVGAESDNLQRGGSRKGRADEDEEIAAAGQGDDVPGDELLGNLGEVEIRLNLTSLR